MERWMKNSGKFFDRRLIVGTFPKLLFLALSLVAFSCWYVPERVSELGNEPIPSEYAHPPRLIRFTSTLPDTAGKICYGMVLSDDNGIPRETLNLSLHDPRFCTSQEGNVPIDIVKDALFLIDRLHQEDIQIQGWARYIEKFDESSLERIKTPVPVTMEQLENQERFIIGAGLNYGRHREEVDRDEPLLLFPKFVAPAGAYSAVETGAKIGENPPRPVKLLDYEAEIGFVLLTDVDLSHPPSYDELSRNIAFFAANDVSDREPIILNASSGYTRGKSHPTYLPTGPWLIHGRNMPIKSSSYGKVPLDLGLEIIDAKKPSGQNGVHRREIRTAQRDVSSSIISGPFEIISLLSERYGAGSSVCMTDAYGAPRFLHDSKGRIPAGSLILTGTPGGTAVRAPGGLDKLLLFVRGGFSIQGAREEFVEDCERDSDKLGYLQAGDIVETWVELLGRQRWSVTSTEGDHVYGTPATGCCSENPGKSSG
jgi:2-keto-4-pentenoate hydratase/2-oxohepta-3-ene-1,7-dioic acid hydratase in catechol pathway